ncbi:MAG: CocE/NonD family hydrolase [Chloroflexota bacterium]
MKRSALKIFGGILAVMGIAASSWRVRAWVISKIFNLPPVENDMQVERGLKMTTADGVTLVGDLYRPKTTAIPPVILIRTAYSRSTVSSTPFAYFFSRRGYSVFVQDVRGTGDSGGDFVPLVHERADGRAAVEWMTQQPWCNGEIATFGLSYLGYTANAIAIHNLPEVKAVFSVVAPATFRRILYGSGGFDFDTALQWTAIVDAQKKEKAEAASAGTLSKALNFVKGFRRPEVPFDALPIATADQAATGGSVDFYQSFVTSADPNAPLWEADTLTDEEIGGIEAPIFLSSNWHDTVLSDVLRDYQSLNAAGKSPRLTLFSGPHGSFNALFHYLRDGKAWFDHHLKGIGPGMGAKAGLEPLGEKPVRFNILNTEEWLDADCWPVPALPKRLYLSGSGLLSDAPANQAGSSSAYVYDPMHPTPAVGGNLLTSRQPIVDNAELEARADTLVFTTAPFTKTTYVIGEIKATIEFEADSETADLFVRVNRVSDAGQSRNVTDEIQRIFFESKRGGRQKVELNLIPTAVRFDPGQRLRLVIASGAHPRIARNLGLDSTQAQAFMTRGISATIRIHHSPESPSWIDLPIADEFVGTAKR